MLKNFFHKFWPAIIITVLIFAFHYRLFFPYLSIYTTPDIGRSDAWHLSIADKFYYAQELKNNRIPIWNPHIGIGYPTLAEGQTGIFFLPNLILFRILPFVFAFNFALIFAFLAASFGIYLFSRSLGLHKISSLYGSLIFSLSAFFIFHVQHIHLLQTASMLPWIFWTTNEFIKSKKLLYLLLFSFFLSQQVFAGFPQLSLYSIIGLFLFYGFNYVFYKNLTIKTILCIFAAIVLALGLSAIQLIPTYELLNISNRQNNPTQILIEFPYKIKNLSQFINPYINGSPKNATYPAWTPGKWGIFWESSAYIGILPLLLAFFNLIKPDKNKKTRQLQFSFIFLGILCLLFALGSQSPTHVLFSIPPVSMFRVPSRFLLLVQFSLALLAGITLDKLIKKRLLVVCIFLISLADLFILLLPYNPIGNAKEWFSEPETATFLKNNSVQRIISVAPYIKWNSVYSKKGWDNEKQFFKFTRNGLDQNQNLIFGIDQFSAYESILTERENLSENLTRSGFILENGVVQIPEKSAKSLASNNISHILTSFEIKDDYFEKVYETKSIDNVIYYVYKAKLTPTKYNFVNNVIYKESKDDIIAAISNKDFDLQKTAVIEKNLDIKNSETPIWEAKQTATSSTKNEYEIKNSTDGLFVISQSYYPEWQAYVDGTKTEILPANINSIAIPLKQGLHKVTIFYKSANLTIGFLISLISLTILFYLLNKYKNIID